MKPLDENKLKMLRTLAVCKSQSVSLAFVFVVFLSFVMSNLNSQTILMPVSGHGDTTMSYAEVYDDGGPSAPYSSSCNATYTFHTVNPGGHYRVEVSSLLTHPAGNARLRVCNGSGTVGSEICSFPTGTGGVFYSSGNTVTVHFVSDDDAPTDGFEVILCEYDNDVARDVATEFVDSTTVHISWSGTDLNTVWYVDWAIVCTDEELNSFLLNSGIYTTDTLDVEEMWVYDVPVGCRVAYRIYVDSMGACSPTTVGYSNIYERPFECPCLKPQSFAVQELSDTIVLTWVSDTIPEFWHVWDMGHFFDTVVSGDVGELRIPYDYPCYGKTVYVSSVCQYVCNVLQIQLPYGGCRESVGGIRCDSVTGESLVMHWNEAQDSSTVYVVSMRGAGQSAEYDVVLDTLGFGTTNYRVDGLSPLTGYRFTVCPLCSGSIPACYPSTIMVVTSIDNCIDYVNTGGLATTHFAYGSYGSPSLHGGLAPGRHTVISDTTLRDPNTDGMLRCVPLGELASFRLGNDDIGAQGETVTYDYYVDSLDKDMLVLNYAVVMQNPNHNSSNQPHFTLELLDQYGNLIDSTCCYADFYAAGDMGWNVVARTNVIWKDWTTVGLDIASYHGQTVRIRLTTKDCADGGHFGYAYFTIHCDSKRIALVNLCEGNDSVRLHVPLGFEYRWMRDGDTTVISTENEIKVPADSTLYHCFATFIGKPECSFAVSSRAVLPVPKAMFDYEIDTCGRQLVLYNRSRVDIDSSFLPFVRQTVVGVEWTVNGTRYVGDTVAIDIAGNGAYYVTLHCRLSDSYCADSVSRVINQNVFHSHSIVGDTSACLGDTVTLVARVSPVDETLLHWSNAATDSVLTVVLLGDTSFYVVADYKSCTDTVFHHIAVHYADADTFAVVTCPRWCDTLGFFADSTGVYDLSLVNRYGCDSLVNVDVTVFPAFYDTVVAATCDMSFSNSEFSVDSTGFYTHPYVTVDGCDSIYCLDFKRYKLFADSIEAEILYGEVYSDDNFSCDASGHYWRQYTDVHGCDSIYALDLNVVVLRFPNVVTPNGDGYNDYLGIVDLLESTILDTPRLYVYDRWGRLIYGCDNIKSESDFWDPNKTKTPDGTYYYVFFTATATRQIEHKGVVEVIR